MSAEHDMNEQPTPAESPGTQTAARIRSECNNLSPEERKAAGEKAMAMIVPAETLKPCPWHIGAQNDALYIIDKPPRPSNDFPNHDADVNVIAKIYGTPEQSTERARLFTELISAWNTRAESAEVAKLREERDKARKERDEAQQCAESNLTNFRYLAKDQKVKYELIQKLTAELAAAREDTRRLDELEKMIEHMPNLKITRQLDDCTEDDIGLIPVGWNIRCNSICTEPLVINAPTFRTAIDSAAALEP